MHLEEARFSLRMTLRPTGACYLASVALAKEAVPYPFARGLGDLCHSPTVPAGGNVPEITPRLLHRW